MLVKILEFRKSGHKLVLLQLSDLSESLTFDVQISRTHASTVADYYSGKSCKSALISYIKETM